MDRFITLVATLGGAIITLVGLIPGLNAGANWWMMLLAIIGSALIVTSLIYYFRDFFLQKFADKTVLLAEHHSISRADDDDAKWIHDRAHRTFGDDVTPLAQINAIRNKYRDAFQVIWYNTKDGKERRGYICAFPIGKACCEAIRAGRFSVLGLDSVEVSGSIDKAAAFYVGGILADDRRAGIFLLHALRRMIPTFKKTREKQVFTRAVTAAGMRYIQSNDFLPVVQGKQAMGDLFYVQL